MIIASPSTSLLSPPRLPPLFRMLIGLYGRTTLNARYKFVYLLLLLLITTEYVISAHRVKRKVVFSKNSKFFVSNKSNLRYEILGY